MNRIAFGISVVMANAVCLAAAPTGPDAAALRQEVLDWIRGGNDVEFTGTVEFVKTLELPADPSRLEQVDYYEKEHLRVVEYMRDLVRGGVAEVIGPDVWRTLRDGNARHLAGLVHAQEFATAWGTVGVEIAQAWRIDVAGPDKIRVELSTRDVRPADPAFQPMVTVAVQDGGRSWQWRARVGAAVHTGGSVSASGDSSLLSQARDEVQKIVDGGRGWLRSGDLAGLQERNGLVVAEVAGGKDASGTPAWTSRLEFSRSARGLLLTKRVTLRGNRYWISQYSDYRGLGARMIPWERTFRSGPAQEFGRDDAPMTCAHRCLIKSIRQGLTATDLQGFRVPAGRLEALLGAQPKKFTYGEISAAGRTPFTP